MPTSRFAQEPAFTHGQAPRTAVLYCNLGTPDAPTAAAVRRYLAEFLSDHRVVEIPRLLWMLILHGFILRVRPAKSAAKYASIWTNEGSLLRIWTEKQALLLQGWLAQRGHPVLVRYAMRYGQNSVASQLDALKAEGVTRVLVLPAYPQYSATTTASLFDAVYAWAARTRLIPELRFVNHYHDDPLYIEALTKRIRKYWQDHGRGDRLVMSFHGVPQRTLQLGDPYHCECQKTGRLLAEALRLDAARYQVTFQSRFGRAEWLKPYTFATVQALGRQKLRRIDVICPGFVADCLETLEEIGLENKAAFLAAGGGQFHLIPCLNERDDWVRALADLALANLQGWLTHGVDPAEAEASRQRALASGAPA